MRETFLPGMKKQIVICERPIDVARTVGPCMSCQMADNLQEKRDFNPVTRSRALLTMHTLRRDLQTSGETLVLADALTPLCESLGQGPSLAGPGALTSRQCEIINVCGFQQLHV